MSLSGLRIIEIQGGQQGRHVSVVWAVEFLAPVLWMSLATMDLQGSLLVVFPIGSWCHGKLLVKSDEISLLHHTTTCLWPATGRPRFQIN
jgi:hypothetical protein